MSNKVFNKIAQELSSNRFSLEQFEKYLGFLINNKNYIFEKVNLLEQESKINLNNKLPLSDAPLHISRFYHSISNSISLLNSKQYQDYFNKSPRLLNLYNGLKDAYNNSIRALQYVDSYLEQERKKEVFLKNVDYKEDPDTLDKFDDQLIQNQSDEAPIQRRPPQVSKLDQLIFKVNQEADKLSNQMYTHLHNTNLDKDTRGAKLTFFNNVANNLKKEVYSLFEYIEYSKSTVSNKLNTAKVAINSLVTKGIVTQVELANKLPNIKNALDLINSFK